MRRLGRPEKYPWDIWLDGNDKLLNPTNRLFYDDGASFDAGVSVESVMVAIRRKAADRDIGVTVRRFGEDSIALRFGALRRRRTDSYPWDRWFDGAAHVLKKGEDFSCSTTSMRKAIYAQARVRGITVATRSFNDEDGTGLVISGARVDEPQTEQILEAASRPPRPLDEAPDEVVEIPQPPVAEPLSAGFADVDLSHLSATRPELL